MTDDHWHLPPHAIAQFDQIKATMNTSLDIYINAYTTATTKYEEAFAIPGLAQLIEHQADSTQALAQYLALAVARIANLQKGQP